MPGKDRYETKKCINLHRGGGGRAQQAFTMAEILLSLTIIGVVAAITLPSLTGNINERTWNTQRKALYARFSQAIALMPALNGYGVDNPDTATETFITGGLSKVLKINNICDNEHLQDCGITGKINPLAGGSAMSMPITLYELNPGFSSAHRFDHQQYHGIDTKAAAFETANGESVIAFYNPSCFKSGGFAQTMMCANFIYDLNGVKGPNTVGKDIGFVTAFYPTDTAVVAPMPYKGVLGNAHGKQASAICRKQGDDVRLPNIEELSSIWVNKFIVDTAGQTIWSSTYQSPGVMYSMAENGYWTAYSDGDGYTIHVRCIKR